jgi:phage internal scaffolding protein
MEEEKEIFHFAPRVLRGRPQKYRSGSLVWRDVEVPPRVNFKLPSLTQQSGKDDADINVIMRRFKVTGMMPQSVRRPVFADFEGIFDFQSAQNALVEANRSFSQMPAEVRERFNNDPARFVRFCSDDNNLDEMRKLGLAVPAPEPAKAPEPMLVRVVPEEPPAK